MKQYKDFAPTSMDCKGLALDDRQEWYVVGTVNRDSSILEEVNYRTLRELCGENHEEHDFGHWACGWIRVLIVPSVTPALQSALDALTDYPVLDDGAYSEALCAAAQEEWDTWAYREFDREIKRRYPTLEDRIDDLTVGQLYDIYRLQAEVEEGEADAPGGGSCYRISDWPGDESDVLGYLDIAVPV